MQSAAKHGYNGLKLIIEICSTLLRSSVIIDIIYRKTGPVCVESSDSL